MNDWTTPSHTDRLREIAARERDARDQERLNTIAAIVTTALFGLSLLDPIEHPAARWSIADAANDLRGILRDVEGTHAMIRNAPLCLEGV